jgi:hypothetical protein
MRVNGGALGRAFTQLSQLRRGIHAGIVGVSMARRVLARESSTVGFGLGWLPSPTARFPYDVQSNL